MNEEVCVAAVGRRKSSLLEASLPFPSTKRNSLDVLKWLREKGCPWNAKTCSTAAFTGRLYIVKWARENGCEWDAETFDNTRNSSNKDLIAWLTTNGCPE
jgi:hypothetical protein